jgi:hypothetical protein
MPPINWARLVEVSIWSLSLALTLGSSACKSKSEAPPAATPSASASAARLAPPARHDWPEPSGPVLAVLAGRGVGPIRVGATVATVERLMDLPCQFKSAEVCRYPNRGVEFVLADGVVQSIHVYRAGRPAGKDAAGNPSEYGFFRGGIPPDLQLGMIPTAIQEQLGQPKKVESKPGVGQGPAEAVETHEYPGLTLIYDRLENGNLVLAEMIIVHDPNAAPPPPSSTPPSSPSAAPSKPKKP